ncbi:MAG: hypothetical protein AB8B53_03105 [Flavobacteriales bacterium]
MKLALIILISSLTLSSDYCDMTEVRSQFHQENDSEKRLETHIINMELMSCEKVTPYLACAIMQRAEHSSWPPTQIGYFNKGKDMLETYIQKNPEDIEARYVRYLVQKGAPGFLGYKSNMDSDYSFILSNLNQADLPPQFLTKMINSLN